MQHAPLLREVESEVDALEKNLASTADGVLADAMEVLSELGEMPGDVASRVSAFARLENLRRDLEEALAAVKKAATPLNGALLEDFAEHHIQRTTAEGLTIFPLTRHYVSKKGGIDKEDLIAEIRAAGWGSLVTDDYSASALKGKITNLKKEGIDIPPKLESMLNIGEVQAMTSRKS